MIAYPQMDPVAFRIPIPGIGSWPVHWYGLMYLLAFLACYSLVRWRLRTYKLISTEQLSDIVVYIAFGVVLGGRLGYVLFYDFHYFISSPLEIFATWNGGMSFHGGLIGVVIALWIFAIKNKIHLLDLGDLIAPAIPVGLALGRLGNFINGELWGRVTTVPWAMVFPNAGNLPRHPSQLYEFFLEGVVMFSILWIFSRKKHPRGAVSGLFLLLYGLFRFIVEYFREPDPQIGYVAFGWMTKGQLLSLPMFFIGCIILIGSYLVWFNQGKKI
jgi:phosphatidylglycerol:prolipoprotein diacylglycerol transferase